MRVIEREMLDAINTGYNWNKGNTAVVHSSSGCNVYLHDNHIATIKNGEVTVNVETLKKWPSNTTKNRLRALKANVSTVKGVTMLNGVDISTL